MYEFLLAVHILAAVIWVGGNVNTHISGRLARKAGGRRMVEFSREANLIGPRLYAPLSLILLIAGFLLVDEAGYDYDQLWISLGMLGWVVSFIIGVAFYGPQQKKLEAAVETEGPDGRGVEQVYDRVMRVNAAEMAILVLVVIDMAVKPGL